MASARVTRNLAMMYSNTTNWDLLPPFLDIITQLPYSSSMKDTISSTFSIHFEIRPFS